MGKEKVITKCRICGNSKLNPILNLGNQKLTGIFPKTKDQKVSEGVLELVKCDDEGGHCGLVQLKHTFSFTEMYGENYGYRSGLNRSMVTHLKQKVNRILSHVDLLDDDFVIDIGSNDGTLLGFFPNKKVNYYGVDPTSEKFKQYYQPHINIIPDFFSADVFRSLIKEKAKVITSIAMFYDLEEPLNFVQDVYDVLDDEGIWVMEQSYMPTMLEADSYDTICHEHLEYYGMKQIKWIADKIGFVIIDVELNDINGGSFSVTLAKKKSSHSENTGLVNKILQEEHDKGLHTMKPYEDFRDRMYKHKEHVLKLFKKIKEEGKKIIGYGASTKGNVLLQFCGITEDDLPIIAEVNDEKFGSFTPGTLIPIVSEKEAREMNPDYFFVLPWHFRDFIVEKEKKFLESGGKLIFPLPKLEIV